MMPLCPCPCLDTQQDLAAGRVVLRVTSSINVFSLCLAFCFHLRGHSVKTSPRFKHCWSYSSLVPHLLDDLLHHLRLLFSLHLLRVKRSAPSIILIPNTLFSPSISFFDFSRPSNPNTLIHFCLNCVFFAICVFSHLGVCLFATCPS